MKCYIGLDVGGTKIEGVLFNGKFKIIKKLRKPTEEWKSRDSIIGNIVSVAEELLKGHSCPVGVAMAGYRKHYGVPNIPKLIGTDMAGVLGKELKTKVVVENDAHCFVLAEQKLGAGKGKENVVGVIIGTGVGGGAIIDNRLVGGKDGAAAHIGHMMLDPSNTVSCRCGQVGDFESWCAGPHIVNRYYRRGGKIREAMVKDIFSSNEKTAKKVADETYQKLGMGFAALINIFNPELIVVGGGVSNVLNYGRIMKEAGCYATIGLEKGVKIVKNTLGDSAGVYGAALLAAQSSSSK